MRKVRYNCAMSLDGYIAGPNDEFDWIAIDPDIDFDALFEQFDTYLLGRRTFEVTAGEDFPVPPGSRTFVFSGTLRQSDYADVTIIGDNWKEVVRSLREESGKDIYLFGGGVLFRSLCRGGAHRHGGGLDRADPARRRRSSRPRAVRTSRVATGVPEDVREDGHSESRVRGKEAPRRLAESIPRPVGRDMSGDRRGVDGPPEGAWCRVTNPERFQPLHASTAYYPH